VTCASVSEIHNHRSINGSKETLSVVYIDKVHWRNFFCATDLLLIERLTFCL